MVVYIFLFFLREGVKKKINYLDGIFHRASTPPLPLPWKIINFFSQLFFISFLRSICHETPTFLSDSILYDMGNFLLKKVIFCQVNINFWRGMVEGGHNGEKIVIDFFSCFRPFRTVWKVFYFFKKICGKIHYLGNNRQGRKKY